MGKSRVRKSSKQSIMGLLRESIRRVNKYKPHQGSQEKERRKALLEDPKAYWENKRLKNTTHV